MTLPAPVLTTTPPAPQFVEAIDRIDALAKRLLEKGIAPGYALAVTDRDGLLVERRYGFANQDAETPIATEMLFEIGSIGKSFTAIVLMQLAAEGKVDLHAPVSTYLPWFAVQSAYDQPITIHHLLTHTGGITGGSDHPAFDRLPIEFMRANAGTAQGDDAEAPKPVTEVFHGGEWFVGEDYDGPTTFDYPAEWDAFTGHYASHNPWPHGFRVVLRKGTLWQIYGMGGGATELVPDNGGFRIGREKPNPDWLAFDVVVNGQAFVCRSENGEEYARFFTP
ncbi:MAG: serine hydrolase domain-containing protein [Thermomicrobiales bacterium]